MSSSVYNINAYIAGSSYLKNDIVSSTYNLVTLTDPGTTTYYFYALNDFTAGLSIGNDLSDGKWGGVAAFNGVPKPEFIWKPAYNPSLTKTPRVRLIKFGDGYEQRSPDGIQASLLDSDFTFEGRDLSETTAICHFLEVQGATKAFLFTPPAPFGTRRRFVCRSWTATPTFYNNYTVRGKFEEVVN